MRVPIALGRPIARAKQNRKGYLMLTQHEARALVEAWLKTYSTFEADSISVTSDSSATGAWRVRVECGVVVWTQVVSSEGGMSAPVWTE